MSAGGGVFFNRFTPCGKGGVPKAVARAGVAITPSADSKDREEDTEGSPLRTYQSMILTTTAGITTAEIITLSISPSATLNTKPGGTQFSIWMVSLPQAMRLGDICPYPAMPSMGNKAWV